MASATHAEDPTRALITLTQNFADRSWRYPVCHAIVGAFVRTPVTPNHVTLGHTVLAFIAAGLLLRHDPALSIVAALLLEVRAIADCFDGVLARAKKTSSPYGRALDQLGDTLGFTAVLVVAAIVSARVHGPAVGWGVVLLLGFVSGISTSCWDFYRRRIASLLEHGRDEVEDEFLQLARDVADRPTMVMRWGWFVANFQMTFFAPSALPGLRARAARGEGPSSHEGEGPTPLALSLRARVARGDPELRAAAARVGFTGADASFLIVCASALFNDLFAGCVVACGYAVVSTLVAAVACNRALAPVDAAQTA